MPITATHLLTNASTSNLASYTTSAGIALNASRLSLAWILSVKTASPAPQPPTVARTGAGVTWDQVASITFPSTGTQIYCLTLFRAMVAAASATMVINFGAVTQQGCGYAFSEFSGVTTTGTNGSGAIARPAAVGSTNGATSLSLDLSSPPFIWANNYTAAGFANGLNNAITQKSGWTKLGTDIGFTTPTARIESQWIAANDTSPSASWSTATSAGGIAVELQDAVIPRRAILTWLEFEVPEAAGEAAIGPLVGSMMRMGVGR